jgi:hypothetical protein
MSGRTACIPLMPVASIGALHFRSGPVIGDTAANGLKDGRVVSLLWCRLTKSDTDAAAIFDRRHFIGGSDARIIIGQDEK